MRYDKDFEELDAELAGANYGEGFDYDMEDSDSDKGIAADVLGSARKTVKKGLKASPTIKGNATEGIANEVTPTTTLTIAETDPYGNTAKVAEKVYGSFSDTLRDMYAKREKAREKRKRTAEKVAVGHALGDLFGAISAHYISGQKNSRAVVPQSLAPKSYAKIQALIDEGIADKNTFDQYMLSLAQKKDEQNIAMAKAEDSLAIKQAAAALKAAQERDAKDAERALKAYIAQLNAEVKQAEIDAKAAEGEKNRQNAIKVAEIRSDGSDSSKGKKKSNKVLENWQRRAGEKMVRKTTTTTSTSTNDLTGSIDTRESKAEHSPNETEMRNAYARAEALASKWGIELGEDTIQDFEDLYDLIGKKTAAGNTLTIDGIAALLNGGYEISQIKKAVK